MVAKYGMSPRLGTISYEKDGEIFVGRDYEKTKSYSERVAGEIDDETKAVIDQAYAKCRSILESHWVSLQAVAEFLLSHGTMGRDQFEACMEGRPIPETASLSLFDSEPSDITERSASSEATGTAKPASEDTESAALASGEEDNTDLSDEKSSKEADAAPSEETPGSAEKEQ